MRSGGWGPHDGDSALTRKETRELVLALSLSAMGGHSEKAAVEGSWQNLMVLALDLRHTGSVFMRK